MLVFAGKRVSTWCRSAEACPYSEQATGRMARGSNSGRDRRLVSF
jgi:hypothetical protein